jgi:acyl carrier protein
MDETERRVVECLAAVFSDLPEAELTTLDQTTHAIWDSVAHATLIAALGEAFEHDFEYEAFAEATTYARLLAVVRRSLESRASEPRPSSSR